MATKYLIKLWDGTGHKVRSLKAATVLTRGEPFIACKLLRGGERSRTLRKYVIEGRMVRCTATKVIG